MYVKSNNWLFIIFIEYKGFYNKLCECVRNDLGILYELGIHSLRKVKKVGEIIKAVGCRNYFMPTNPSVISIDKS